MNLKQLFFFYLNIDTWCNSFEPRFQVFYILFNLFFICIKMKWFKIKMFKIKINFIRRKNIWKKKCIYILRLVERF